MASTKRGNTAPDFQTEFARLLNGAKPEVSGAVRSSALDWDLTLDGLCRLGLLSFQSHGSILAQTTNRHHAESVETPPQKSAHP